MIGRRFLFGLLALSPLAAKPAAPKPVTDWFDLLNQRDEALEDKLWEVTIKDNIISNADSCGILLRGVVTTSIPTEAA